MKAVDRILTAFESVIKDLESLKLADKVETINTLKRMMHDVSPFKAEPVDCVQWVPSDQVTANDYNPNAVAPPEMALLRTSIEQDGYTQPIVSWHNDQKYEVVDGYHRHRVGKECSEIQSRIKGYLPLVVINSGRTDKGDRMAATIRHNRARGKHKVQAMSEIVIDLKRRRWSDEKIAKNLGMEPDEILRLGQIGGIVSLFQDSGYSQAWDPEALGAPTPSIDESSVLGGDDT